MDRRYEQFNEMTFEAYIKSAIDKSVLKARKRQAAREKLEQSFSTMTDVELFGISHEDQGIKRAEQTEPVGHVFRVRGRDIPVYGTISNWLTDVVYPLSSPSVLSIPDTSI